MVKPEPIAAANQFHALVKPLATSPKRIAAALPSRRAITTMDPNPDPCLLALHMPVPSFVRTRHGASPSRP